jgi:hypothetical protein
MGILRITVVGAAVIVLHSDISERSRPVSKVR